MPWPFIVGALAVVGIGAAVTSFVFDELTEEEKAEQSRVQEEFARYKEQKRRELEWILAQREVALDELSKEERQKLSELELKYRVELQQRRDEYFAKISERLEMHYERRKELEDEIHQTIVRLRSILKRDQVTLLRGHALEQLLHNFEEGRHKMKAYLNYLRRYRFDLEKRYKRQMDFPAPFEFVLPPNYPYTGKLIYMEKSALAGEGIWEVSENMESGYLCPDYDQLEDYDDEANIPILVESFDAKNRHYVVSVAKGIFKDIALFHPGIGLESKVIKHEKSELLLKYRNFELKLHRNHLENPRRTPPRGSKIRVFPKKWDYALRFTPEVTEKYQESLAVIQFQSIPLVINDSLCEELSEWMAENESWEQSDEWKIAPLDEGDIPNVQEVKLQYGTDLVLKARIVHPDSQEPFLQLEEIMSLDHCCKPDDIFVVIRAQLDVVLEEELEQIEESKHKELQQLGLFIIQEFRSQKAIKESHHGMVYYNKWAALMDKLITYRFKGNDVFCETESIRFLIKDRRSHLPIYQAKIQNIEEVKLFISETTKDRRSYYFLESKSGSYLPVEFSETAETFKIYGEYSESHGEIVRIFQKNYPYPEIQQKQALNVFREGRLENIHLKTYLMDAKNVDSKPTGFLPQKFFNSYIEKNEYQKDTVQRALKEEEFFMIQGPPGTGKTTVIIEIIRQYISQYPHHRILVVSQANVAVDNVMKDLIDDYNPNELIRCGKEERMEDEVKPISFEYKYEQYMKNINNIEETSFNSTFLNKWKDIVETKGGQYNSDVGELILRSHNIVGATCVGLAQKNIGLDRLHFDLVIIDEAGKALPAELLIPINRAKKLILIGDHKQLPPTLDAALYDQEKVEIEDREYVQEELFVKSLFERLIVDCPDTNKSMLRSQYRMPAVIGDMVSELFYEGKLENGSITHRKQPIFFKKHLNILDMSKDKQFTEEHVKGRSPRNPREAEMVVNLVRLIRQEVPINVRIAVITPYKGQRSEIKNKFLSQGINPFEYGVAINTVDAFQGDEAEIVLYCTTRARSKTNFFSDVARLNVALSRSKSTLVIIGSMKYMKSYGEGTPLYRISEYIEKNGDIIHPRILPVLTDFQPIETEPIAVVNPPREVNILDIHIPEDFKGTPPRQEKIVKAIEVIQLDPENMKPIAVKVNENTEGKYILKDGYSRYLAAKELGMKSVKIYVNQE